MKRFIVFALAILSIFSNMSCRGSSSSFNFNAGDYLRAQLFVSRAEEGPEATYEAVVLLENKSEKSLRLKVPTDSLFTAENEEAFVLRPQERKWLSGTLKSVEYGVNPPSSFAIAIHTAPFQHLLKDIPERYLKEYINDGFYRTGLYLEPYAPVETSFPGFKFIYYKPTPYSLNFYLILGAVILGFFMLLLLLRLFWSFRFVRASSILVTVLCALVSLLLIGTGICGVNSVSLLLESPPDPLYLGILFLFFWLLLFSLDLFEITNNILIDNFVVALFLSVLGMLCFPSIWSTKHLVITHTEPLWLLVAISLTFILRVVVWLRGN